MSMFGHGSIKQEMWEDVRGIQERYDLSDAQVVAYLADILNHVVEFSDFVDEDD